jgi:uncharacterized membrane-anchored protein
MKTKIAFVIGLGLMVLVQIAVPSKMIWDQQSVTSEGQTFHFRTEPVDPTDPFRGKYIILSYQDREAPCNISSDWKWGETAYAVLEKDNEGFAIIKGLYRTPPTDTENYIQVTTQSQNSDTSVTVNYAFNRYYMEESKAYDAELAYRDSQWDEEVETYAVVYVRNGAFVLHDVMIDGVPIKEVVENLQELDIDD